MNKKRIQIEDLGPEVAQDLSEEDIKKVTGGATLLRSADTREAAGDELKINLPDLFLTYGSRG